MKLLFVFLVCFIPTLVELIDDRRGDKKKVNDLIVLTFIAAILATVLQYFFKFEFWRTLPMMFAIHFLLFDYIVVILLRKNGVIRADADPFTYTGKTSKIDQIVAKINPWVRLLIRVIVFGLAFAIFALV